MVILWGDERFGAGGEVGEFEGEGIGFAGGEGAVGEELGLIAVGGDEGKWVVGDGGLGQFLFGVVGLGGAAAVMGAHQSGRFAGITTHGCRPQGRFGVEETSDGKR